MTRVIASGISVSLDGYMAGPDQSRETPLGVGGEALHEWVVATKAWREQHGKDGGAEGLDNAWAKRLAAPAGATIMGRNMFGPIRGPWPDHEWRGWWGKNPPYHNPVFVLTHHARPSVTMEGGTTYHFVTGGPEDALRRAREAAGDRDIRIGGGASTLRQYLDAGAIDELHVAIAPILLGGGERLLEGLDSLPRQYRCATFRASDQAMHVLLVRESEAPPARR